MNGSRQVVVRLIVTVDYGAPKEVAFNLPMEECQEVFDPRDLLTHEESKCCPMLRILTPRSIPSGSEQHAQLMAKREQIAKRVANELVDYMCANDTHNGDKK